MPIYQYWLISNKTISGFAEYFHTTWLTYISYYYYSYRLETALPLRATPFGWLPYPFFKKKSRLHILFCRPKFELLPSKLEHLVIKKAEFRFYIP